ncbi:hypothetical protein BH160DRAFT_0433 [Burkholderia sp. H160]|nr:hypothetical protein BH160DRAFT_0433 [Burkholderia sp. H160]
MGPGSATFCRSPKPCSCHSNGRSTSKPARCATRACRPEPALVRAGFLVSDVADCRRWRHRAAQRQFSHQRTHTHDPELPVVWFRRLTVKRQGAAEYGLTASSFHASICVKVDANVLMAFDGPTILDCREEAQLPQPRKQDLVQPRVLLATDTGDLVQRPLGITGLSTVLICSTKVLSAIC